MKLILGFRTMAFAAALFFAAAAPVVMLPMGGASQANCFAHWAYGLGEGVALMAILTLGLRRLPVTTAVHAAITVGWVYLVSKNCALWLALFAGQAAPMAHHAM